MNHSLLGLLILYVISITACRSQDEKSLPADVEDRISLVENSLYADGRKWTIEERMASLQTAGLSIAVIHNYKLDWAKGYGFADLAEKRAVDTSTLFQAASISKSLTGVGALKLVQQNKITLDEDINTYLKSWKFPYDKKYGDKKITLKNLLTHTAGLSVSGFRGYENGRPIPTVVQILNGESPANNEPVRSEFEADTKVQYAGGGTTIAQLMMMDVSGKTFDQFMSEAVLTPLGMTSSFYQQPNSTQRSKVATGYLFDKTEVPGKFAVHPEQAAASLWTNPTDLAKYIIETQLALAGKSSKVLNQEMTKLRLTPYKENMGLGVFIQPVGNAKYFQHSGANQGFRALYVGDFKKGNGVAIMVNSENNKIVSELLLTIANIYHWDGYSDSGVKLSAAELKGFEGYYQLSNNADLQLQIIAKEKQLMLRQLWDGNEFLFDAQSELEFLNKENSFPLKFSRDASGEITEVLAFNRDVWKKDGTYTPVVKQSINLTVDELKIFEGKYQLRSNKSLVAQFFIRDNMLVARTLWDGKEMTFVPETRLDFYVEDNPYRSIKFVKDKKGKVKEVIAFGREALDKIE